MNSTPLFDFDRPIDRRGGDSLKWNKYAGRDVLPLWVADMDFAAPPALLAALERRIAHGCLGYAEPWPSLVDSVLDYLSASMPGPSIRNGWSGYRVWLRG